jgi:hypothetical protein
MPDGKDAGDVQSQDASGGTEDSRYHRGLRISPVDCETGGEVEIGEG